MKIHSTVKIIVMAAAALFLGSCRQINTEKEYVTTLELARVNHNKRLITEEERKFENLSGPFPWKSTMHAYTEKGKSRVYINIQEFLPRAKFETSLDANSMTATLTDSSSRTRTATFNWKENTITLSSGSLVFFNDSDNNSANGKADSLSSLITNRPDSIEQGCPLYTIPLGPYGFEILYNGNRCLVPLYIANALFLHGDQGNVAYNGEKFLHFTGMPNNRQKALLRGTTLAKLECPADMRLDVYNALKFELDFFCGFSCGYYTKAGIFSLLNGDDGNLSKQYLSTNKKVFSQAVADFVYGIDSYTSGVLMNSFYCKDDSHDINLNQTMEDTYAKLESLTSAQDAAYGNGNVIYSSDKTLAVIRIKNLNSSIHKEFKSALEQIDAQGTVIHVVLDLTTCNDGTLLGMQSVLGYMKPMGSPLQFQAFSLKEFYTGYQVNHNYELAGGFKPYKWSVMTSTCTGFAGEWLANTAVTNKCLTSSTDNGAWIGQQPAFGESCLPRITILPDGTIISMPSTIMVSGIYQKSSLETDTNSWYLVSGLKSNMVLDDNELYNPDDILTFF